MTKLEKGEELVTSYVAHNNDGLWADYGFILENNRWDALCLDPLMLSPMTSISNDKTRHMLEGEGYWGFVSLRFKSSSLMQEREYFLGVEGPCYRTQVAIRTQTLGLRRWQRFVHLCEAPGDDNSNDKKASDFLIHKILIPYFEAAIISSEHLSKYDSSAQEIPDGMLRFALQRWRQIKIFLEDIGQIRISEARISELCIGG